ncbi:DMT family transporter [Serinicoccus sp. LYQ131]|uniref:DMT family transporter n=1 Tax=Serinicoccus sp. LYQ131 TaxID=3378797 RepID=UPI0038539CEF
MRPVAPSAVSGILLAGMGVLAFSFSFPGTVWALDGFGPWSAIGVRGVIAAILAAAGLLLMRGPVPARQDWAALGVVALGCAVGFPLLTTLALQTSSTAHSAVVIGALPMVTASISAWRTRKRYSALFWVAAGLGALAVITFTLTQNHGRPTLADLYLFGALVLCAAGYAEGGRLSAHMAGWRVIAWGVLLATPINLAVAAWALTVEPLHLTPTAVGGMLYIACVSQFLGFVLWYRGMGVIGVARASQLQLAQPLLTLLWAVLLMGETLPAAVPLTAVAVLGCIVATQRART